jgi:hypothetical protein
MAFDENEYSYEATSVAGVLQQLAACHLRDGYHFYVSGEVREGKDPHEVDEAILGRYGIRISKYKRARRKKLGLANLHYLRFRGRFLILATVGEHAFYEREDDVKDVKRVPIKFAGHSVGYRGRHSSVRIEDEVFRDLKAYFQGIAVKRPAEVIGRELRALPFVRFAPVRNQLYGLWKEVNRRRKAAGLGPVSDTCVKGGRKVCRPFEPIQSPKPSAEAG